MIKSIFLQNPTVTNTNFRRRLCDKILRCPAEQAEKSANPYNQGGQPVLPVPKEISPYPVKLKIVSNIKFWSVTLYWYTSQKLLDENFYFMLYLVYRPYKKQR